MKLRRRKFYPKHPFGKCPGDTYLGSLEGCDIYGFDLNHSDDKNPTCHAVFGPESDATVGAWWGVHRDSDYTPRFDALPENVRTFMLTYHQLHR